MLDGDPELEELITCPEGILEHLEEYGVAIVRGVLSRTQCEDGLRSILQHQSKSDAEVNDTGIEGSWFSQRYPFRDDVLLPYDLPTVSENLTQILGMIASPLMELLGEEAMCTELAAHISQPGAAPNSFHRDHRWTQSRQVVSCFTALQDIPYDLGPTEVLLGTHKVPGSVENKEASSMKDREYTQLRLRCGDVAIMDARLIHRGGARPEVLRDGLPMHRVLFYTSWRDWCCNAHNDDYTPSLLPEYVDRLPLKDSATWCVSGPMARRYPFRFQLLESLKGGASDGLGPHPFEVNEVQDSFEFDDVDIDDIPEDAEAMEEAARGIMAI